jgi:hypothetical protein
MTTGYFFMQLANNTNQAIRTWWLSHTHSTGNPSTSMYGSGIPPASNANPAPTPLPNVSYTGTATVVSDVGDYWTLYFVDYDGNLWGASGQKLDIPSSSGFGALAQVQIFLNSAKQLQFQIKVTNSSGHTTTTEAKSLARICPATTSPGVLYVGDSVGWPKNNLTFQLTNAATESFTGYVWYISDPSKVASLSGDDTPVSVGAAQNVTASATLTTTPSNDDESIFKVSINSSATSVSLTITPANGGKAQLTFSYTPSSPPSNARLPLTGVLDVSVGDLLIRDVFNNYYHVAAWDWTNQLLTNQTNVTPIQSTMTGSNAPPLSPPAEQLTGASATTITCYLLNLPGTTTTGST